MYRITYSESVSQAWAARNTLSESQKRRVYRWGTHWGILGPDNKWLCESRTQMTVSVDYLVEYCAPTSMDILPKEMDDIWEEEYVSFPKGEYTGLVILKGDTGTVLETAAALGLPRPVLPLVIHAARQPLVREKTKSRCMIQD